MINLKKKKSNIVILPTAPTLMEMKKKIMKTKGIDIANSMYKIGESAGNDFGQFVKGIKSRESKIKKIFEILNSTGYGRYELRKTSENSVIVKLTQSPFTKFCSRNKRPSCYWISGLLSGLFNNVSKGWLFEKNKCKLKDCPYCEFRGEITK